MLLENTKKHIHRFEFIFIVILIIAVPLLFFNSSITGFVASDTKAQVLNYNFTESQALDIKSPFGGPVYISSFSISGDVIGDGGVAVYLTTKDTESLVYTNAGSRKRNPSLITGTATGITAAYAVKMEQNNESLLIEGGRKLNWPGKLGENSASGSFTAVCIDSCYLDSTNFTADSFELQIFVEPGTIFNLQEILYTIG